MLGDHVKQAGSLVGPDRLRFDFSHYESVTPDQVRTIEDLVNAAVLAGTDTLNSEVTKTEAEAMGAIAFFGDKYGERVRVLRAGPSLEFCGGTHVHNIGQIGAVKITGESSIGSNLRRIEATTGLRTLERLRSGESMLAGAAGILRVKPDEVTDRVARLLDERKVLEKEIEQLKRAAAGAGIGSLIASAVNGIVVARVEDTDRDPLKDLALAIRDSAGIRGVVLGSAPSSGGVALVSAVRKDSGLHASDLITEAAKLVQGGGGKSPELAIAGGRKPEALDAALAAARIAAGI